MDDKNISNMNNSHDETLSLNTWNNSQSRPNLNPIDVVTVVIYVFIFVVGLLGNLLVLWVTSSEVRRSINAIWFLNLAVTDLLSCLALPSIIAIIMHGKWLLSDTACSILPSLFSFNLYASVLLLATISADRFLLVFRPVWCQNYRMARLAWLASGVAWILALVLSIPSFVFRKADEDSVSKRVICLMDFKSPGVKLAVTTMQFVLSFLAPLVTMSVCYTLLLLRMWRRKATRSTKTLKVVVAVVTSFFIFWLPYQVHRMVFAVVNCETKMMDSSFRLEMALASMNCCINPIIYVVAARGLHIRVFKFQPGQLHQLLTEDWDRESKSHPLSKVDSEVPKSQIQV